LDHASELEVVLLTTAKDAVKLKALGASDLPIIVAQMELEFSKEIELLKGRILGLVRKTAVR
jgi:tetraacyldisaccharide-1-P 4'-kinase